MHELPFVKPMKMEEIDTRLSNVELKRTLPPLTSATLEFVQSRYAEGSVSKDPFYTDSELDLKKPAGALLRVGTTVNISSTCPHASVRLEG